MLNLKIQITEKHDEILDLFIEARESQDIEALKAAKEIREQVKTVNEEIRSLHDQIAAERKAFREEVKNGNIEAAGEHIDSIISLITLRNGKIQEKIELLDDIIDVLS